VVTVLGKYDSIMCFWQ